MSKSTTVVISKKSGSVFSRGRAFFGATRSSRRRLRRVTTRTGSSGRGGMFEERKA